MTSRARLALIAATLAGAMLASRASAQSSLQVPIQFDFLNPGARSLALGGAFVGVADDATAALVNPAGLIELTRTELSVEGRVRRFEQPVLTGGRLSGAPTGIGEDTVAGPVFTTISNWQASPAFLAYVHPRGSWRIAAFRHDSIQLTQDFSSRGPFQNHGFDNRDSAFTATRTLNITSYGASVARQWPRLWVGGGLFVQHVSLGFDFQRFFHTTFYGAPDPAQAVFHFTQEGDDVGVGAVASAMVPLKRTKIGVLAGQAWNAVRLHVVLRRSLRYAAADRLHVHGAGHTRRRRVGIDWTGTDRECRGHARPPLAGDARLRVGARRTRREPRSRRSIHDCRRARSACGSRIPRAGDVASRRSRGRVVRP
ncbi:MAG: hypothetical protein QM736_24300 [Vicinamibacterales bacterium]